MTFKLFGFIAARVAPYRMASNKKTAIQRRDLDIIFINGSSFSSLFCSVSTKLGGKIETGNLTAFGHERILTAPEMKEQVHAQTELSTDRTGAKTGWNRRKRRANSRSATAPARAGVS
jgi:hypothetical protein